MRHTGARGQEWSWGNPARAHSRRSGEGSRGHGVCVLVLPPSWLRDTEEHVVWVGVHPQRPLFSLAQAVA